VSSFAGAESFEGPPRSDCQSAIENNHGAPQERILSLAQQNSCNQLQIIDKPFQANLAGHLDKNLSLARNLLDTRLPFDPAWAVLPDGLGRWRLQHD
jgi:hypothetical protein